MTEPDRVGGSISYKVQIFQYEPVEVSAWAELGVEPQPGMAAEEARRLTWEKCWQEVSQQLATNLQTTVAAFKASRREIG